MPEKIVVERLKAIAEHISIIEDRMIPVKSSSDFESKEGFVVFDSILIRLQAIGENIKKIEAAQPGFIDNKLAVDVRKIMRFRDFISHHYEKLDTEIIFETVILKIPELKQAVQKQLNDLQVPKKRQANLIKKITKNKRGIKR